VGLSVREHISGILVKNFANLSVYVACHRGSVLICRRCYTSYISRFVDDVIFCRNGSNSAGDASTVKPQTHGHNSVKS